MLKGTIADRLPAFRKGNILVSMNNLGTIAVVDTERESVVWAIKADAAGQHDPKILPNGHMLFFDNQARQASSGKAGSSRVIELDPVTGTPVCELRGTEEVPLYSAFCGAAMRLPNGNTLITESDGGRALEVTRDRDIV